MHGFEICDFGAFGARGQSAALGRMRRLSVLGACMRVFCWFQGLEGSGLPAARAVYSLGFRGLL